MEHKNLDIINKFFEAYGKHDLVELRKVLDENARWIFPGQNPLSGIKVGIEEIVSFFDAMGVLMGKSNIKVEKLVTGINDNHIVECQHIWTNREDGINLDHHWCVLWTFQNGKIVEGKHFAENQYLADEFFTKHFG
jgi:uncharacterized protein